MVRRVSGQQQGSRYGSRAAEKALQVVVKADGEPLRGSWQPAGAASWPLLPALPILHPASPDRLTSSHSERASGPSMTFTACRAEQGRPPAAGLRPPSHHLHAGVQPTAHSYIRHHTAAQLLKTGPALHQVCCLYHSPPPNHCPLLHRGLTLNSSAVPAGRDTLVVHLWPSPQVMRRPMSSFHAPAVWWYGGSS